MLAGKAIYEGEVFLFEKLRRRQPAPSAPPGSGTVPLHRSLRTHDAGALSTRPLEDRRILIILLCDSRKETPGIFFDNPTLKMKLASVGIDPDPVGFSAGHVSIHHPIELLEISSY